MTEIIQELKRLVKTDNHGTASDRALLLDYQATMETKPLKAIQLEKEALSQIKETTKDMPTLYPTFMQTLEDFIGYKVK